MKLAFTFLLIGLLAGGAVGWYLGNRAANEDWQKRTVHGVAVDCYDSKGNLVPDKFAGFGGVQLSCAPGQTAKVHQPTQR